MPLLEVIVVAYRGQDLLRDCLQSLRDHPTRTGETKVHVVDSASGDGTAEMVAREFPEVELYPLAENAGFSYGNNVAIRNTTAPYVLLLNPDTAMEEGTLDHCIAVLQERPQVGMVGCRLYQPDGTFDHAAKRTFPTPAAALGHFTGLGRGEGKSGALAAYRTPDLEEDGVGPVDAVNGAFMFVSREALERVGLLDEGYWLYMEDLDWCARFWEAGYQVLYDGRVGCMHVKGGSAGKHRAWKQNLHFHRGMGRFYRRHQAGKNVPLDLAVYAGIGAKLAISATRSAVVRHLPEQSKAQRAASRMASSELSAHRCQV